ncbi:MAG: hypothetical protein U9P14_03925 [Gemmatimonadota bacterium]|nr:hypothetical protein [Gemmatimonadota bacterium]
MQSNILKLSFMLSYLTLLVCMASGIPFMTALFRTMILMLVFSGAGLFMRWYLLRLIESVHITLPYSLAPEDMVDTGEEAPVSVDDSAPEPSGQSASEPAEEAPSLAGAGATAPEL